MPSEEVVLVNGQRFTLRPNDNMDSPRQVASYLKSMSAWHVRECNKSAPEKGMILEAAVAMLRAAKWLEDINGEEQGL